MPNLLDLLPEDERKKAIERGRKRFAQNEARKGMKISPEIYATAEFGYYYGWDAIQAVRNNEITLDEMNTLLEGARKVWYSKLVEQGGITTVAGTFKSGNSSYSEAMKPYTEKADLG